VRRTQALLVACLLLAGAPRTLAAGEHERFQAQHDAGHLDTALLVLDEWKAKDGMASPQIFIDYANLWLAQATESIVQVTTHPSRAAPGEPVAELRPEGSSEVAGTLRESVPVDGELAGRAAALLAEALEKFPQRLDIHLGHAAILERSGRTPAMLEALDVACREAKADPAGMLWAFDAPLEQATGEPVAELLPSSLQAYASRFIAWENAEGDAVAELIAKLAIEHFPEHVFAHNTLGALLAFRGEYAAAVASFEHAHALAPRDVMVLDNMSRCREALGDVPGAIADLRQALAATQDAETRAALKDRLGALKAQR
jgi:tetratricopeptide (TPR) repeat protein